MFFKIDNLKIFARSTGKHLCRGLFSIKLESLSPATLLKRDSSTGFEIFKNTFFCRIPPWLLLAMLSVRKLLQQFVIHFAVFCQPVNRNQVFSIFKQVHEFRHEQANWSIRHKWRKDRNLIIQNLGVLLFLGPQPPAPAPFTFLRPPAQITFTRPLTMELLFHGPQHKKLPFHCP